MMPVALYPDAELVAVTWLRSRLAGRPEPYAAGVTVGTKVTPGRYVRLRRVGGAELHEVADSPRLQAQIWYQSGATTDEKNRNDLAQLVWALLRGIQGQEVTVPGWPLPVVCYRVVTFSGPIPVPDPADESRTISQLAVEIGMRGRAF